MITVWVLWLNMCSLDKNNLSCKWMPLPETFHTLKECNDGKEVLVEIFSVENLDCREKHLDELDDDDLS